ncbi:MAG: IS1182 family transposase, partial [Nitrososphaerota archaeon]|nr:IS1182 family transposase [Nitrososphaerota archaeon]
MTNIDYVKGQDRDQLILFPGSINEYIDEDNAVRVIDEFVDSLNLDELGFIHFEPKDLGGRPAYDPYDLLKLYLCGYLNGIRTSRKLARECKRNIELMWLLRKLTPDFRTISDFRKDNIDCIKRVFRKFVELCKGLDLIGGELVGVDGTKLRAVNSKSRNFNKEKLKYRIKRLELHIAEYLKELEASDQKLLNDDESAKSKHQPARPPPSEVQHIKEAIRKFESKKTEYTKMLDSLRQSGQNEVSLTDPDSRLMKNNEAHEVSYNAQIVVDSKNHLIPDYYVTNAATDENQLVAIATSAREALGIKEGQLLAITADKGYYNWVQLKKCLETGIIPYIPEVNRGKGGPKSIPEPAFYKERFIYDGRNDSYSCPAGKVLPFRRWWTDQRQRVNKMYWADGSVCANCQFKSRCTTTQSKRHGRIIIRWQSEEVIEQIRKMMETRKAQKIVKRRKEL